ncbi:MAG TPA: hypothetical protein VF681_06880 [Abditibacteriaceae bacterium]
MQTFPFSSCPKLATAPVQPDAGTDDCVDFAYLCCQRAQEAARCGRMQAAHGLVQTAASLYERAERESAGNDAYSSRLDRLVSELCLCAQIIEIESIGLVAAQKPQEA